MRKILIADSSEVLCMALIDALQDIYEIHICQDGLTALELLRVYAPDVFVLDLLLPRLDGITLLQMAHQEGIQPLTLATTLLVNDYVTDSLEKFHVGYLMVKPCDMKALVLRIKDFAERLEMPISTADPRTRASELLMELGVPTKLKGFAYAREAILTMSSDFSQSITKELYPAVAEKFDGSASQIERSIRNAIEIAWKKRNTNIWSRYFCDCAGSDPVKPTNAEFITRLAHCIDQGLYKGSSGDDV